jgi:cobalt-zinc-cadmium efflux system membrane fusion protein
MNRIQLSTVAIATIALALGLSACKKDEGGADAGAPQVSGDTVTYAANSVQLKGIQTAVVEPPRERELILPGRLSWDEDRTVRVFTPFAGRVTRLVANVGDKVVAGQVLAEMTSPDFGQAQADARKAEADLAVKRQQLARIKELAAAGIAATRDLQQAESDFVAAEAEHRRAGSRLATYGGGSDVDQRFALKSPIAGVVVEKNINPGQELRPDQPGAPQFVVTDPTRLWVQLDANEADLKVLKSGTPIFVSTNQYADDTFAGELKQVSDFIDPQARTLKLRGVLPNPDRRLKAEMFVNARINLPKGEYPTVPEKAVYLDGVRGFVFVKTGPGAFTRRGVRVGAASNGAMPVLAGLKEGDEVVVAGNLYLQQMLAAAGVKADAVEPAKSPKAGDVAAPAKK